MINLRRRCLLAFWVTFFGFVLMLGATTIAVFIPLVRNLKSFESLLATSEFFPLLPLWAVILLAVIPNLLLLWIVEILFYLNRRVYKPLIACDHFILELADNRFPEPLKLPSKTSTRMVQFMNSLNLVRDRLLANANRLKLSQHREVKAKKNIDVAADLKSIIISRLLPDVRLPLQSIEGFDDIIKAKSSFNELSKEDLNAYMQGIKRSIVIISNLIVRIGKFAEIGKEMDLVEINTVRTGDIIKEVIDSNKILLNERDVKINTLFSNTMPEKVTLDDDMLIQVMLILARAVARASEHGEDIFIYCDSDDNKVYFHVRDNKKSACRENLSDLFNNFDMENAGFNEYNSLSTTVLGLFFVKVQLSQIGGELEVKSSEVANNEIVVSFNKLDILSSHIINSESKTERLFLPSNYLGTIEHDSKLNREEFNKHNYRVILGEDSKDNAFVIKEFLEMLHFKVEHFDNSDELLKELNNSEFDGIILSNSMRHRNLLKLIKNIRAEAKNQYLPIVVLVSKINKLKERELQELGVASIMLKPINFVQLANRLQKFIKHSKVN